MPIGIPGELHIGGVQVAVGYVNQPELTAERFIPDPFDPPGRLYKTGDLARWLPDGQVDFLGRLDHQVKLRGQRIELGEIEATLGEHPAVLEAAVTVVDTGGEPRLVAHLAWRAEPAEDTELRSFLERRLPAAMVPGPLRVTRRAAADRQRQGRPQGARASRPPQASAPRPAPSAAQTSSSASCSRSGARCSTAPDVGPDDRVFDLGATSLQAAAFVNRVQKELGRVHLRGDGLHAPRRCASTPRLLTREYPAAIARRFGVTVAAEAAASTSSSSTRPPSVRIERRGARGPVPIRPGDRGRRTSRPSSSCRRRGRGPPCSG